MKNRAAYIISYVEDMRNAYWGSMLCSYDIQAEERGLRLESNEII